MTSKVWSSQFVACPSARRTAMPTASGEKPSSRASFGRRELMAAARSATEDVGQAQQLKRALHGSVFAVAAMQGDEAAGKAFAPQLAQVALCGVERVGIHAARAQRLQNALSRLQRDFALRRAPAHENGHFAKRLVLHGHAIFFQ